MVPPPPYLGGWGWGGGGGWGGWGVGGWGLGVRSIKVSKTGGCKNFYKKWGLVKKGDSIKRQDA